jgi:hypothetical protein
MHDVPVQGTLYPFPPKPSSRNEFFQSDLLFNSTQFGKVGKKPDPLVRKRRRILMED